MAFSIRATSRTLKLTEYCSNCSVPIEPEENHLSFEARVAEGVTVSKCLCSICLFKMLRANFPEVFRFERIGKHMEAIIKEITERK